MASGYYSKNKNQYRSFESELATEGTRVHAYIYIKFLLLSCFL